jgi:hypothetical protein
MAKDSSCLVEAQVKDVSENLIASNRKAEF